jgi:voltage-gated potassium channel
MAGHALRPAVMDFLDVLVHSDDLDMWMEEILVAPDSQLVGVQIGAPELHETAGVSILALRRADGHITIKPGADVARQAGDTLIVLGKRSDLDRMDESLKPLRHRRDGRAKDK